MLRGMEEFVEKMKPQAPLLAESISTMLDAYGHMISILPDFGYNEENFGRLNESISSAHTLRINMIDADNGVEILKSAIEKLPRMTSVFNHAKRNLLRFLMNIFNFSRGINLLSEIELTGNEIKKNWSGSQ